MTHRRHWKTLRKSSPRTIVAAAAFGLLALAATVRAAEPVRVATLLPYVEDALVGVDGVVVVATVRRDLHTPPAAPRIDLGNPHAPSFEKLAEARPNLIVGDKQLHGALRDKLAVGGAEVVLVDSTTIDATLDGLVEIGTKCGAEKAMSAKVADARKQLGTLALSRKTPTLVVFGTPGSFLIVSNKTWLGDLVTRLNFENLGAEAAGQERHPGFVQVSDEVLAGLRPQVVLMVAHGDPEAIRAAFVKRLESGGPWEGLRAAATGGVHVLPPALFTVNPGLDVPAAARHLHDIAEPRVGRAP